jgi:ribosomal protein S27AE
MVEESLPGIFAHIANCSRCEKYPAIVRDLDGRLLCGACVMIEFDERREKQREPSGMQSRMKG